jgi:hypothetical protein
MTITPSYVGELECNGVIERFTRTLKEQCLYLHRFQNLAEAHRLIGEFIRRYNTEWLIERLSHQTPVAARTAAMAGPRNRERYTQEAPFCLIEFTPRSLLSILGLPRSTGAGPGSAGLTGRSEQALRPAGQGPPPAKYGVGSRPW